jgi:hypothetical protein
MEVTLCLNTSIRLWVDEPEVMEGEGVTVRQPHTWESFSLNYGFLQTCDFLQNKIN